MVTTRIAIVGLGHWGQQYLRNFLNLQSVRVVAICDEDRARLEEMKAKFHISSAVLATTQFQELISPQIDAVVIATPASTHYTLTRFFLDRQLHVLTEKPLCLKRSEAQELVYLAREQQLTLMLGHTLLFAQETIYLKRLTQQQEFGRLLSAHAQRLNLGRVHEDCNVIWDLAPHDIAVLLYLNQSQVHKVHATAKAIKNPHQLDYASIQLEFKNGMQAQILLSWIDPCKTRKITLVGDHKHAVFDDCKHPGSLEVFSKAFNQEIGLAENSGFGEKRSPELPQKENLQGLCEHFIECILGHQTCISPGEMGLDITTIIESIHHSIERDGAGVEVHYDDVEALSHF